MGRPFVPEVAQKLVNDLSTVQVHQPDDTLQPQPGQCVEPVQLQVVCYSLWEQLPPDCSEITQEHLDRFVGDVDKALGNYFAARVEAVAAQMKQQGRDVSEHDIREWFGTKLITSDGTRNMVAREKGGRSGGLDDAVVQEFVHRGDLVRAEKRGGATFYELTHDRLVDPIRQNNREWLETKADLLQRRVGVWLAQRRNNSLLLRGRDLRQAHRLARSRSLNSDEKVFLDTSSRAERTRLFLIVATGLTLLLMGGLTIFAMDQSNNAQDQRNIALTALGAATKSIAQAQESAKNAQESLVFASTQAAIARENEQAALDSSKIANAQRAVTNAKIQQSMPGGLLKSTLLAMNAMLLSGYSSEEAQEILRENLTFLPRHVDHGEIQQAGAIDHIEFNADGTALFTSSWDGRQGQVCGWRLPERKQLFCQAISARLHDLFYSPASQLMTADTSGKVRILNPTSGEELQPPVDFNQYKSPIRSLEIGADGRKILVTRSDGSITVKDLKRPGIENAYLDTSMVPSTVVFSPSSVWLAAGSKGGTVAHWGLNSGAYDSRNDHSGLINVVRFSPDDRYIISGGKDHYALVTETVTNELRLRLLHSGSVRLIEVSPDGTWLVTATDNRQIRVWDLRTGKERARFLQESPIRKLIVSPKGKLIVTVGDDKNLYAWNAETGKEIMQIPLATSDPVLAFNPADDYLYTGDKQGRVSLWDIFTLTTPTRSLELSGNAGTIKYIPPDQVAFSDGVQIWIMPADQFRDLTALPRVPMTFPGNSGLNRMALSPDLKYLAVATEDNDVMILNTENRIPLNFKPQATIKDMLFSADGRRLVMLDTEGHVQTWDFREQGLPQDLSPASQPVSAISGGPGFLALGTPGRLWTIDPLSREILDEKEYSGDHTLLATSADGSLVADANSDGQINIWEQKDHKLIFRSSLTRPQALALAFNPDGKHLAVGTARNVFLIDTASGQEIARIPNADLVNDISFSSDGKLLTVASSNLMQTWDLKTMQPVDDPFQAACKQIGSTLDASQWNDVLSQYEYELIMNACGS
jgi:WD40 repeat protein